MTDAWDPTNPEHKRIAHGIEVGDGIPEMRSIQNARNALKKVGFEIQHEEDLADRGDKIPWYYPIAGSLRDCQTVWDYFTVARMTKIGRATTTRLPSRSSRPSVSYHRAPTRSVPRSSLPPMLLWTVAAPSSSLP